MMNLHTDKEAFQQIIDAVSENTGTARDIIEKDYYVTMILEEFFLAENGLVFKGGTSLSKGYHLINRFSEDIDLNYIDHTALNRNKRREIKYTLKDVVDGCDLHISNFSETRSNRNFNRYEIEYNKSYPGSTVLKPNVVVETAFQEKSFPCENKQVQSLITEYLSGIGANDIIVKYHLEPFDVMVQHYIRTFIDKAFALCDYYLADDIDEHSRHIYDLHKIYPLISFNDDFKDLFLKVRHDRQSLKVCLSARSDKTISALLNEIIDSSVYKNDYNYRTALLITDETPYDEAIASLRQIASDLKRILL